MIRHLRTVLALLFPVALAAAPAVRFEVRYRPLASQARVLQALSMEPDDPMHRSVRQAFAAELTADPVLAASVEDFGRLAGGFLARAEAAPAQEELPWGTGGVLPPRSGEDPEELLHLAFLRADTPAGAARNLGLGDRDSRVLVRTFEALAPAWARIAGDAPRHRAAAEAMTRLARESGADAFLARVADFYGVTDGLDPRLEVSLLWMPSGRHQRATQASEFMIVPTPLDWLDEAKREETVAGSLTVAVHEFGHYFFSLVRRPGRSAMADLLVHHLGVPNPGRVNLFDEALQSTLGSLVFQRDHLPAWFREDESVYGYLKGEPFPDAIVSVARALEPVVRAGLAVRDGFRRRVLPAYPGVQARLFGRRPAHFAAVSVIYASRDKDRHRFGDLFRLRDRYSFGPGERGEFLARSAVHAGASRWLLLRPEDLAPDRLAALGGVPPPGDAQEAVRSGRSRGFWWARRRTPRGGFEFWLVAGEGAAMRDLLVDVHRAGDLPEDEVRALDR